MARKPEATLEVLFDDSGILPEKVPMGMLARVLNALQRLAAGQELPLDHDETEDDKIPTTQLSLLDVKRGSAIYRCVSTNPAVTIQNVRTAGRFLRRPENVEQVEYVLSPLEELSAIAKSVGSRIIIRTSDAERGVIARIEPDSFDDIARDLMITGDTTIVGYVERVGGATQMRCALRVGFQSKLLYCKVASPDVVRRLGHKIYEQVAVSGKARWLRHNWRITAFTINDMYQPKKGSLLDAMKALREAGGSDWDKIKNPEDFLREATGT